MAAVVDVFNTSTRGGVTDPFRVPTILATSFHTGGSAVNTSGDGSNQQPVNTEIYVCEVNVTGPCTVTGISFFNGTVDGTDSRHAALVDKDGTVVPGTATGATLHAGTDSYEQIPFSGGAITLDGPAVYFVAHILSGGTARCNAHTTGDFVAGTITGQTYGAIVDITLPTTFTTAVGPYASLY